MATRAPRKSLTAEDLKKKLADAKEAIKVLERKAFASEITEAIKKSNIPADFKKIKDGAKGVTDIAILETIGEIVGIKRLVVSQSEPVKRKPKSK
ncbi:hypothetical protein FD975_06565 [Polynucleobacter sp. AP-Jannik-300A-C4]|uniref:hypothetical protein n=1 Tax=Polynucleobacter sp. AP-Jannik-300A-C4 TaxID=2576928 RepID=UPI001BFD0A07|nr:hypothetical protein [Polynucleobacter sp. AP-Jannik-300A-C4]QWE21941.1 hypothetical protein FD975_06565 [Polynucleobacter sp. AP-Jannik-300A-C4]